MNKLSDCSMCRLLCKSQSLCHEETVILKAARTQRSLLNSCLLQLAQLPSVLADCAATLLQRMVGAVGITMYNVPTEGWTY
jgi:hypothetical protein